MSGDDATRTIVDIDVAADAALEETFSQARPPTFDDPPPPSFSDRPPPPPAPVSHRPPVLSLPVPSRAGAVTLTPSRAPLASTEPVVFAGRYQVNGVLGGGAMGTVYRALDRALDENVALKLLKRELAVSPELVERFRREVKLARRVTHRNIARVFDIGAHGQQPFLTMELIEGGSLGDIIARRGALPPREVHTLALELCAGLGAAHAAGVIHRDLKPENVLIEGQGGRVVITDFGVACALSEGERGHGGPAALVGSPAYMAPEQVEGVDDPDARADIYALGVMLYEICTSQMPWEGSSIYQVAAARLVRPPPDPRARVPELPAALADVILKCMARRREDRFADPREVVAALAKGSALPAVTLSMPPAVTLRRPGQRTVAVLPLVNDLGAEGEYFARGYVADLLDHLGALPSLHVRHAPFILDESPRDMGRSLGAQTVVCGSLERAETGGIRLVVGLVTVEDGLNLWLRRSDADSVLQLSASARLHAGEIARILDAHHDEPARGPAIDPRATDLHMQGRLAYRRAWFEANETAVQLLESAHALAPRDASIAGTLALALARDYGTGTGGGPAAERARDLAEGALAVSPQLADARVALAALHAYAAEGVAAAGELRRTLSTTPDAVEALDWTGRLLVEVGDAERGIAYLDRAQALEPTLVVSKLSATLARALVGDWARVLEDFALVPSDPSDRIMHHIYRVRVALWRNETDLPLPALENLPDSATASIMALFHILSTRTISPEIRGRLERALPTTHSATVAPRRAILNAQLRAELLAYAGLRDEAAATISDADATGLFDIVWLEGCPVLESLRAHPDWSRIHRSVGARAARVRAALDGWSQVGLAASSES